MPVPVNDRIEGSICNSAGSSWASLWPMIHIGSPFSAAEVSKGADRSYLAAGSKRPGWTRDELPGRNNDGLSVAATVRHCSLLRRPIILRQPEETNRDHVVRSWYRSRIEPALGPFTFQSIAAVGHVLANVSLGFYAAIRGVLLCRCNGNLQRVP